MKLNKEQRFCAYCIMLAEIECDYKKYVSLGFCYLTDELFDTDSSFSDDWIREFLPDLFNKKPYNATSFWFESFGLIDNKINNTSWQNRIQLLKQCIKETSPD